MPSVAHRKGIHRYVLTYSSEEDLTALCEAIIELAERPDLEFGITDAVALAITVTEQIVREELLRTAGELPADPGKGCDGPGLAPQ